jgi:DNA-binding transcriptional LysR family regulator
MDLRQLEIFAKVAEMGSFSRAAEALHLTQPTVSEHIRALEDELGVRLLDRLGRGTATTRAGQLLLSYATRILALSREARQALEGYQGRMRGELVVGGSTIPGEYLLPAVIGRFREKFPEVSTRLVIGGSQAVVDWVADGRVELGVVGARLPQRGLEFHDLSPDEEVVVVPAGHPWQGRAQVTLEELSREPLIIRERGSGTRAAFESALERAGVDLASLRIAGEMGSNQAIKQAVKAGLGITVMSRIAVEDESRQGVLAFLRVRDLAVTRGFYVVTHRERSRSPVAEAFRLVLEGGTG